jgi:hypothetical protein
MTTNPGDIQIIRTLKTPVTFHMYAMQFFTLSFDFSSFGSKHLLASLKQMSYDPKQNKKKVPTGAVFIASGTCLNRKCLAIVGRGLGSRDCVSARPGNALDFYWRIVGELLKSERYRVVCDRCQNAWVAKCRRI